MSNVAISVVVPTYNRRDLLTHTLHALKTQTLARDRFEVVVVDDGSSDESKEVVDAFSSSLDIKYFWQEDKGFRLSKARNIGTMIAEGKYIVYLDTGVMAGSSTLERHLHIHESAAHPMAIIGYVYGFEADHQLVVDTLKSADHKDTDGMIRRLDQCKAFDIRQVQYDELGSNLASWPAPFDILWGCHMSAERSELIKAGLFDERFNTWGGEDVDLGVRLHLNHNQFHMDRAIHSLHLPHEKLVDDIKTRSAIAAKRIHESYNLWSTSFYGLDTIDVKYSLNKAIRKYAAGNR